MSIFNNSFHEDDHCECGYMTSAGCATNPTPFCHLRHPGDQDTWYELGKLAAHQGLSAVEGLELLESEKPNDAERYAYQRAYDTAFLLMHPPKWWEMCPYPSSDPRQEAWMLNHEPPYEPLEEESDGQ